MRFMDILDFCKNHLCIYFLYRLKIMVLLTFSSFISNNLFKNIIIIYIMSDNCKYICECGYKTDRKYNYKRHIKKHNTIKMVKKEKNKNKIWVCDICQKHYKFQSGLSRHKTNMHNNEEYIDTYKPITFTNVNARKIIKNSENNKIDKLMNVIIEQNKTINKTQKLLEKTLQNTKQLATNINNKCINNINTINNEISINLYLNENYKNAMNLTDFIKGINISIEDIENTGKIGYIKTIKKLLNNQLISMDPIERPIICSDKNKLLFYVKDENKWSEDKQHKKINDTVINIRMKQFNKLKEWEKHNPNFMEDLTLRSQWNKLVYEIYGDGDEETYEKRNKAIIKNLANDTYINKKQIIKNK